MNRLLSVLTILLLGCTKLLADDEGDHVGSETDSTDLSETDETGTSETASETGETSDCEPGCECHEPDWVCQPADSEVDIGSLCNATLSCAIACDPTICDDIGTGDCEAVHEEYFASAPSQTCIDLLIEAESCYFGLTCAELGLSRCDPIHPCYQSWEPFLDAGCEFRWAGICE